MDIYLVGGAVRDLLMGKEPSDKDYLVVNSSREEMLELGYEEVGKDFPVFLHPNSGEEYALARIERKIKKENSNEHQSFEFETDFVSLEEDLLRRDLTINSIAMDEKNYIFYDPCGGLADLKNKILRHTSPAFVEDPLRVLRVARFNARFPDFSIDSSTLSLMGAISSSQGFKDLPVERVFAELQKALSTPKPEIFFEVLHRTGSTHHFKQIYSDYEKFNRWIGHRHESKHKPILTLDLACYSLGEVAKLTGDIASRYITFASILSNPKKFGESIGAPSDWIRDSKRVGKAFEILEEPMEDKNDLKESATSILACFKELDAFGNSDCFDKFLLAAEVRGYHDTDFFKEAYKVVKSVTSADMDMTNLKGLQIKAEFERLRIERLIECIRNL